MPSSMLFGISNDGKIFGLSTVGKKWRQFPYLGLEFKKISVVPNFLWALGGDRQIYLYVHHFDIPIRIKEEVYENQRWFPIEGFGKRLLITDRFQWSNERGTVERKKENVRLPSMAWQWESDWQLELNLDGQSLNYDGWTYAIDFPATYYPVKQWSSYVRRRKWYRYRRYGAMYTWCAIPPLHTDATKEPFIDICIGGHAKIDENKGMLFVWAITIYGRIMFRWGVHITCPDGVRWSHVPSPKNAEVKNACCSPTGVLWIILGDGRAAVRYGITHQCPTGEKWLDVAPPEKNLKLINISAGLNSVWAISNDYRVWFRKGLRLDCSQVSEELSKGSGWVEMVGEMICISVSAHDQVFAINKRNKRIYYRSGIDNVELMGRKWRLIEARTQLSNIGSQSSISTTSNSVSSLSGDSVDMNTIPSQDAEDKSSKSAPPCVRFDSTLLTEEERRPVEFRQDSASNRIRSWSPIRSGGSLLAMEVNPDTDDSSLDTETQKEVFREKDDLSIACQQQKTLWSCVCAGAVDMDDYNVPKWFFEEPVIDDYNRKEPWRGKVLMKLKNRNLLQTRKFETYEMAIETVSWTKTGEFKVSLSDSHVIEECVVELEWIENSATGPDSGTFAIFSKKRENSLLQVSLAEIICVMNCSQPGQYCFSVHTVKMVESDKTPLKLFFSFEKDFEDWFHSISTVSCMVNGMFGIPSENCIWCTTELGDIYMTDITSLKSNQSKENSRFFKEFNVREYCVPFQFSLLNGFPINSEISIIGRVPLEVDRFFINLECNVNGDIAFHFNPRFNDQVIVRNSNIDGKWGKEEREGKFFLQPQSDFILTILCLERRFKIFLNGLPYAYYEHRLPPENITDINFGGQVEIFNILYESTKVILHLKELFWRKIQGYLYKVETCLSGVTWGLGYNSVPWVYIGKSCSTTSNIETSNNDSDTSFECGNMIDTKVVHLYENQRWNPLTSFTTRGLPTDRYMWSDETGRLKLTKDGIKLPNSRWQWVNVIG